MIFSKAWTCHVSLGKKPAEVRWNLSHMQEEKNMQNLIKFSDIKKHADD